MFIISKEGERRAVCLDGWEDIGDGGVGGSEKHLSVFLLNSFFFLKLKLVFISSRPKDFN